MGLSANLKAYAAKGGDPQKVIDRLVEQGDLPGPKKWNSDARRKVDRHPEQFTAGQISEAFRDDPSHAQYLIELSRRRRGLDIEPQEDDDYEDEEDEDDEDEDDDEEEDEED